MIPEFNANAIVLTLIALLILANVAIVLVFRGARHHNDNFDQQWIQHYRDDDDRETGE